MASYGMNDVKNGMKILVNNQPAVIIDTEYVKPGKGQAFTRVKYRLIKDGRTQEVTMKSTDSLDAADVVDTDMNFMYSDGEYWHFMDPETFEQVQATLRDLRAHDVEMVTIGQYLQPTAHHHPVLRYWTPEEYKAFEDYGYELGFTHVASGPMVRSSYHADQQAAGAGVAV